MIPIFVLGQFAFKPDEASFKTLTWSDDYGWQQQEVIGHDPLYQKTKGVTSELEISGVVYPGEIGTDQMINRMRAMGDDGNVYYLSDGVGRFYGRFIVLNSSGDDSFHLEGGVAMRQTFKMKLARVGRKKSGGVLSQILRLF